MKGKICMVTGANSGIGKVTAIELARKGARIIMVCRNKESGEAARAEIMRASGTGSVELILADLSSQQEIRKLVDEFRKKHDRLHVLVNNAGIMPTKRTVTVDGYETAFAVNHLAPFLLTNLLLDMLKASAPARVVAVSSGLHKRAEIDFNNLQAEHKFVPFKHYGLTKLANVLFSYELARRLRGTNVTSNCTNPGMTKTNLGRHSSAGARFFFKLIAKKVEKGAATIIYVASAPELERVTGKYFDKCREARSSDISYDENIARQLWEVSERLTGLAPSR